MIQDAVSLRPLASKLQINKCTIAPNLTLSSQPAMMGITLKSAASLYGCEQESYPYAKGFPWWRFDYINVINKGIFS